jgi:hypothetical protein
MFKELYKLAIALVLKPSETWLRLRGKDEGTDNETFLNRYVYPFIGMVALASFLGVFLSRREFDLQLALKSVILTLVASVGGFFFAAYAINYSLIKWFKRIDDFRLCQRFVGYASTLIFAINIVLSLLPEFFFLRIFVLYTIYIVWEGAIPYMGINEKEQLKFSIITTLIIILSPLVIGFVLRLLMPGLRF